MVCIGEVFGTISDSVRLRTCLMYCRAFRRTAKSASTAVAEHAGLVQNTSCVEEWLQTDSVYSCCASRIGFSFPVRYSRRICEVLFTFKGKVRTINDRNICERRSCMKYNGKSPTLKFVSGEEIRPSEVQRVSRDWRLSGATHSSADLTWIRK